MTIIILIGNHTTVWNCPHRVIIFLTDIDSNRDVFFNHNRSVVPKMCSTENKHPRRKVGQQPVLTLGTRFLILFQQASIVSSRLLSFEDRQCAGRAVFENFDDLFWKTLEDEYQRNMIVLMSCPHLILILVTFSSSSSKRNQAEK